MTNHVMTMDRRLFALLLAFAALLMLTAAPLVFGDDDEGYEDKKRNTMEWNLPSNKLAIKGYDPVAYFAEGGGKARKGSEKIHYTYEGVTYYFASKDNRKVFDKSPRKYECTYGGWCAWAMKDKKKADIDPRSFIVKDGRLFLFAKGLFADTKKDWLKGDHDEQAEQADKQWKKISGENPRKPRKDKDDEGDGEDDT